MTIPEQAVEAASEATWNSYAEKYPSLGKWAYLNEEGKEDERATNRLALKAAQPLMGVQRPEDVARGDALYDSAYIAGAKAGYNCGVTEDQERLKQIIGARSGYLAALPHTGQRQEGAGNWTRDAYPPEGGDCRKLVTLEKGGMIWVGIRAWNGTSWLNNGVHDASEQVLAWQPMPTPAYSDGLMGSMAGPTLPAGDGQW